MIQTDARSNGDNHKVRVLLADDHAILRDGLSTLINMQSDMEVVAQAETSEQALLLASECRPDVIVLDVSMQPMGGAQTAEKLAELHPRVPVLALTRHKDPVYVQRMLEAGAKGYILKQQRPMYFLTQYEKLQRAVFMLTLDSATTQLRH
jgi:DNA-binding NarL/FixJ family response regulator